MADEQRRLTRGEAIRAKCLDCSAGDRKEVRLCPVKNCPLWIYRMYKEVEMPEDELTTID